MDTRVCSDLLQSDQDALGRPVLGFHRVHVPADAPVDLGACGIIEREVQACELVPQSLGGDVWATRGRR